MFEQFRKLLRENRQLWSIVAAAVLTLVLVAWGVWGGFSFEFSRFFASETPVDPSGACKWEVRDNAPEGAWFCKNLNCQLDGNPSGGEEFPPQGPASKLRVKIYGATDAPVNPADGPIHIRTVLDATPKCGNGKECYPPKDPLWTCTAAEGVMYQGRDGSDYFSCYNPIIHRTNYGPIECCANTGLAGDCFTWTLESSGGTPTDFPPPVCAPANQTVAIGEPALLQATEGNGTSYTWDFSGGGVLEEGGNRDIVISWNTPGQKIIRVTSAGKTSEACVVFVSSPSPSPSGIPGAGTVSKLVRNTTLGGSGGTATTVAFGQTLVFTIRIENNGTAAMTGLVVKDQVPVGTSYITGSTRVENVAVPSNAIAVTGLQLGRLEAGDPVTIEWSAVANQSGLLQPGSSRVYTATVTSDAGGSQTAGVTVGVTGTAVTTMPPGTGTGGTGTGGTGTGGTGSGGTGTPGSIPTGPSDSVLVALGAAALISLLYASYTRSPYFRRHELKELGKQRDPLDFRG